MKDRDTAECLTEEASRDRAVYFDAGAGIAGDMVLASLLHAGASLEAVREAAGRVARRPVALQVREVRNGTLAGLTLSVSADNDSGERSAGEILDALHSTRLAEPVIERAARVFRVLAEAEARVHGVAVEDVHFHEIGALDSIVDIVGTAAALHDLDIAAVHASPLPMTRGWVDTRHGRLPVPAPATVEVLAGYPVYGVDAEGEFVTPTGAALCKALAGTGGPLPPMRIQSVGCGFGTRDWPDGRPNCLRALVGILSAGEQGSDLVLSANIDDMTPEGMSYLIDALLAAGSLDAWVTPIVMKKGRPAWVVSALAPSRARDAVVEALFAESTTLGVRLHPVERRKLYYEIRTQDTSMGPVRVKRAFRDGRVRNTALESDDLRRLARERGVPLRRVREVLSREVGDDDPG
jgi:uncharacterized protein (TIGR00299 family) protein